MIPVEIKYLDGEIEVQEQEPSTIAELTDLLGSELAVVEEVTANLRYRNKYPRVYREASKQLESVIARTVKEEKTLKDGTVKKVMDSETNHLRAAFKADPTKTTEVITSIAQAAELYVKGERTGGGGKVSAASQEAANSLIAEGDETVENAIARIEEIVPGYKIGRDGDGNITPESLARGIQALQKHAEKQAKASVMAQLGGAAAPQA